MSRWLRPAEYDLDDFDPVHGRIHGPTTGWSRDDLKAVAMIAATGAVLAAVWLVLSLIR